MTKTAKDKELLAAYLVVGSDTLKREAVVARLKVRMEALGDLAFNSDTFDGETSEGSAIVVACNTVPFASEKRLVLVRNAEKLRKADSEQLVAYLANPCDTTVLLLEAEKLASNTRLRKAVSSVGPHSVIDCAPPSKKDLPAKVREMAVSHNVTISDQAARRLIEFVGEDTVRIDAELKKIALVHVGSQPISAEEIGQNVARTNDMKWWTFVDAFSDRDLKTCMACLAHMSKESPFSLLPRCVTRIRELICAQSLTRRGSIAMLGKELGLPDWKVKSYRGWARKYTSAELRQALSRARDAERRMKSGSDQDAVFLEWLIATLR